MPATDVTYEIWQRQDLFTGPWGCTYRGRVGVDPEHPHQTLDQLFETFNVKRPDDFTGHSLSVGDRVVLGESTFACATLGWTPTPHPLEATVDKRVTPPTRPALGR